LYNKKLYGIALLGILVTALVFGGCTSQLDTNTEQKTVLKVLIAGSLTSPMEKVEAKFEADHKNVDVQLEPAGSLECIKKITELETQADVLASADYTLIPSMMIPKYADWYVLFAKNEMVLTYSDKSKYASIVNENNWYKILDKSDVMWAFSNPNLDPCGYRTPMTIQLAEFAYSDDQIFENLVSSKSKITVSEINGSYIIITPEDLAPDTKKVTIRNKSVELVSMVQEGGLDYAWEYISVAVQNNMKYVILPESINLSDVAYADTYNKVKVKTSDDKTQTAKPIVYGITVPKNAPNAELANEFVKYVIDENGQQIFNDDGQPPVVPAKSNDKTKLPQILQKYVADN
jgi:molybdate/tungstate transport system substrate-binding protein